MRRREKSWDVAALPFFKFHNQHESGCPVSSPQAFAAALGEGLELVEKADGTGLMLWFDGDEMEAPSSLLVEDCALSGEAVAPVMDSEDPKVIRKREKFRERVAPVKERKHGSVKGWRVSTFGSITPDEKFERLFWNLFGRRNVDLLSRGSTYLFELCCEENRVVTRYPIDVLFLLACRVCRNECLLFSEGAAQSAEMLSNHELDRLSEALGTTKRPSRFPAKSEGLNSLAEVKQWVEAQSQRVDLGSVPEGFVAFLHGVPVAKMKNSTYLSHHLVATGDVLQVRNAVVDLFFEGKLDDLEASLPSWARLFAAELEIKIRDLERKIEGMSCPF